MKTNKERLQDLFSCLENLSHVKADEIPDIDLYMDQVVTFMDSHLKDMRRHPGDKVLTKTMINDYAKNNLLPPSVKKKCSKDYMLMLVFIYCFKSLLSFSDIEELSRPATPKHLSGWTSRLFLENIYNEVFTLEKGEMNNLRSDVATEFARAQDTFSDAPVNDEGRGYLKLFVPIRELPFDVYLKTQMIETIANQLRGDASAPRKKQAS